MFVTLVHIHVKPDQVDTFLDATRANHEASIREDGNLRFDVLRLVEDPNRFLLYEWYADEASALRHRDTPHYLAWREATVDVFAEPRYGVRYEGLLPGDARGRLTRAPGAAAAQPDASPHGRLRSRIASTTRAQAGVARSGNAAAIRSA